MWGSGRPIVRAGPATPGVSSRPGGTKGPSTNPRPPVPGGTSTVRRIGASAGSSGSRRAAASRERGRPRRGARGDEEGEGRGRGDRGRVAETSRPAGAAAAARRGRRCRRRGNRCLGPGVPPLDPEPRLGASSTGRIITPARGSKSMMARMPSLSGGGGASSVPRNSATSDPPSTPTPEPSPVTISAFSIHLVVSASSSTAPGRTSRVKRSATPSAYSGREASAPRPRRHSRVGREPLPGRPS